MANFECQPILDIAHPQKAPTNFLFDENKQAYYPFNLGPVTTERQDTVERARQGLDPKPEVLTLPDGSVNCGFKDPHLVLLVPGSTQTEALRSVDEFLEGYFPAENNQENEATDAQIWEMMLQNDPQRCLCYSNLYIFLAEAIGMGYRDLKQLTRIYHTAKKTSLETTL